MTTVGAKNVCPDCGGPRTPRKVRCLACYRARRASAAANPVSRFLAKVDPWTGTECWIWRGTLDRDGYGVFGAGGRQFKAHRFAYVAAGGTIADGEVVRHDCDVRACCYPRHLRAGTQGENHRDCEQKGRHSHGDTHWARRYPELIPRGEDNGNSKLTEQDVAEIRAAAKAGTSNAALAERFRVDQKCVYNVVHRRTWRHRP